MAIEESLQKGVSLAGQGMLHQALAIFEKILEASPDERSEEHTSELQSLAYLLFPLLL